MKHTCLAKFALVCTHRPRGSIRIAFFVVPLEPCAGMSYAIHGYIVLEYYHTCHRYIHRARLLEEGRLRSMGLLVVRVPHHVIQDPATVDKRCVYEDCVEFLHRGKFGELRHWHKSPLHGKARFCWSPMTEEIECCEVSFNYLGANECLRQIEIEILSRDNFVGYHGYHAEDFSLMPWCSLHRSKSKEQSKDFFDMLWNAPVMDREGPTDWILL